MPQCPHGKHRYFCKPCRGGAFCEHERQRRSCRDCAGAGICEHSRLRHQCRDCAGTGICEHDRQRYRCKDCGGISICEHHRHRRWCKDCGGKGICEHGRQRNHCKDCNNFVCNLGDCQHVRFSGAAKLQAHMQSFHSNDPKALTKRKELCVFQALTEAGVSFDYQVYLPFRTCGLESETRHAFVDFVIARPWGNIVLEVDEEQHSAYDPSCDPRRDFDIFASVAMGSGEKVVILRYNPDPYKIGGVTRPTSQKERLQRLLSIIEGPEPTEKRLFLYYDRPSADATLPCVAEHWDVVARIISRSVG